MSEAPVLIRTVVDAEGVLIASIDMPGRTMNVFSEPLIDELQALIERVERDDAVVGVVIGSGKDSFLAGADLAMVRDMTERARSETREQMFAYCGRIGRLFLRIEESAKPWVAAVNGTALGGGLELTMACRARLISVDANALLGVPEVKLGLLPGAGGTQRLPRLVGLPLGLELLLSGRSLNPMAAVKAGLFEPVAAGASLLSAAQERVHALRAAGPYRPQAKFRQVTLDAPPDDDAEVRSIAKAVGITPDTLRDYPAYRAIIRAVLAGVRLPMPEANDVEMTRFLDLMFDPVAGNMVQTLFLQRQRVEKAAAALATTPPNAIAIGPLSARAGTWQEALTRSGITLVEVAALQSDMIEVPVGVNAKVRLAVGVPGGGTGDGHGSATRPAGAVPLLLLSERSAYGRVIELVSGAQAPGADALGVLAALARKLQCLLLVSDGGGSVLDALIEAKAQAVAAGDDPLDAMALRAAALSVEGRVPDTAVLDVAAVLSGVAPAFSGGPFRHIRTHAKHLRDPLQQRLGDAHAAFLQGLAGEGDRDSAG